MGAAFGNGLLAASGGFLLAVLWMDLMFDVQALGHPDGPLPPEVLASIAGYYRRVTTEADPMRHLIGAALAITAVGAGVDLVRGRSARGLRVAAVLLALPPVALAFAVIFPSAVALGAGGAAPAEATALARRICAAHLYCFASMAGFVAVQLLALRGARMPARRPRSLRRRRGGGDDPTASGPAARRPPPGSAG